MKALSLAAFAALAVLGSACLSARGEEAPPPQKIDPENVSPAAVLVSLRDFKFEASTDSVKDGTIDFLVKNEGVRDHEFVIVRRDGDRYELPLGEIEAFPPQATRAMRVTLAPGNYELVCLIISAPEGEEPVSHMALGMRLPFEVNR